MSPLVSFYGGSKGCIAWARGLQLLTAAAHALGGLSGSRNDTALEKK